MKKNIILMNFVLILFLIGLIINPKEVMDASSEGLVLWYKAVLPSLFPFMVCINLLMKLDLFTYLGKLFKPIMRFVFRLPGCTALVWLSGITTGYPIGAKITADMLKEKKISLSQAQHLLNFSNNSGPLFILGTVAVGMLNKESLGPYMLIVHIVSSIIVGVIYRFVYNDKQEYIISKQQYTTHSEIKNTDFGKLFGDSIYNAMELIIQIGGFIIIFSVVIMFIDRYNIAYWLCMPVSNVSGLNISFLQSFVSGLVEITNGINIMAKENINLLYKLIGANFLIAFSGFSIHAQTASVIKSTGLSFRKYFIAKVLQSIIAVIITIVTYNYAVDTSLLVPTFISKVNQSCQFYDYLNADLVLISIMLCALYCLIRYVKRLKS